MHYPARLRPSTHRRRRGRAPARQALVVEHRSGSAAGALHHAAGAPRVRGDQRRDLRAVELPARAGAVRTRARHRDSSQGRSGTSCRDVRVCRTAAGLEPPPLTPARHGASTRLILDSASRNARASFTIARDRAPPLRAPTARRTTMTDQPVQPAQIPRVEELFQHIPHPRIAQRKNEKPVKVDDERVGINGRVALIITAVVGTMWCAYIFTLIALVSLPSAISSGQAIIIVAWIAQTFIQLVLLPIIIVGQNIQGKASDKRSEQTYKDAEAILQRMPAAAVASPSAGHSARRRHRTSQEASRRVAEALRASWARDAKGVRGNRCHFHRASAAGMSTTSVWMCSSLVSARCSRRDRGDVRARTRRRRNPAHAIPPRCTEKHRRRDL